MARSEAYYRLFAEIPSYSDRGSQNQLCRDIVPRGILPGVVVGYDIIEGPGRNGLHQHATWHQAFVVLHGRGTLIRGDERIALEAPCVVDIPPLTDHDVLVAEGERIEYVYVTRMLEDGDEHDGEH
jgi:mannose-6-phosphate isomerase-like protein (cupin superfamily)